MSFVDPRNPPHLIGDNWRYLARAANVEADTLPTTESDVPETEEEQDVIRVYDPTIPYVDPHQPGTEPLRFEMDYSDSVGHSHGYMPGLPSAEYLEGLSQSVKQEMAPEPIDPRPDLASELKPGQTFDSEFPYSSSEDRKNIPDNIPKPPIIEGLVHSPVVPVAPRRERTLSDYYGVFGPPKRRG